MRYHDRLLIGSPSEPARITSSLSNVGQDNTTGTVQRCESAKEPHAQCCHYGALSHFEGGLISAVTMPSVMVGTCATTSPSGFMTLVGP